MVGSLHPKLNLTQVNWTEIPDVKIAAEGDFILLTVNSGGIKLKKFIEDTGPLEYSFNADDAGNSYFEWKTGLKELKQNVDVVVYNATTCDFYTGNGIRRLLSLPDRGGAHWARADRKDILNFAPVDVLGRDKFPVFISSTSITRTVKTGDRVLYRKATLDQF
jgi:hypothetical protein